MPRSSAWERKHLCPRNAMRPPGVSRKRIASKNARAPRKGRPRNISYDLKDTAKMNSPKRGESCTGLRKWFTITAAATINVIASLPPHKLQFIYSRVPCMPCAVTFPSETRPDKKPLSSESFFAVQANCRTRVNVRTKTVKSL
ncbi:MAG: hypothetical protein LBM04_07775 [Opitutaceae bacterium]|jgi:hypothetical protein|nr:hypothetical protein [Opitutaceae bacterium]